MKLTGFQDRLAFVTGAAGGIGQALVAALQEAGAMVVATDTAGALVAGDFTDSDRLIWQALDVGQDSPDALIAEAEARFGPLMLGVHAAGVLSTLPMLEAPAQEWDRVMDVNARGTFNVTTAFGRAMVAHGKGGAMVTVSSNAAGIPRMNMGIYAASKAAATMLTRCLGLELARHGIRCNIVAPGSTLTPMQTGMWQDDDGAARVIAGDGASFRAGIPLGKLATPEDIAAAVMYLLSEQAGHVTMSDIYVDGGATLRA